MNPINPINPVNSLRRKTLQAGGASVLAWLAPAAMLTPGAALAQDAFAMKTMPDALRALGAPNPAASNAILIKAPEIAENGAVVPITIESKLPKTESITLLVEKNPQPLAASFNIPAGTEANVTTRVKMGESSFVYALVKSDGKYFVAKQEIKITLGGCGG